MTAGLILVDEKLVVIFDFVVDVLATSTMLLTTTGGRMGQVDSAVFTIKLRHFNEIDLF